MSARRDEVKLRDKAEAPFAAMRRVSTPRYSRRWRIQVAAGGGKGWGGGRGEESRERGGRET